MVNWQPVNNRIAANSAGCSEFFLTLLHAATNAHLLHLQTKSFAAHMALDALYKGLPELVDELIEAYQGKNGLITDYPEEYELPDKDPVKFVTSMSDCVKESREEVGEDTELQNIIDEIAQLLDTTLYKLRFLS